MDERLLDGGPEYFAEAFPQDAFPRYVWGEGERPATMPEDVWLSDTSHRDGQQGGIPLTTEQSCRIYDILCEITGDSGILRHAEFFPYRTSDRDALQYALDRYRDGAPVEPTTWIRARREDVQLIQKIGVTETGLLSSSSDYHTFHKFTPGGRRQAAAMYLEAVEMAFDHGIRPRVHLEDTTRSPVEFVQPLIEEVLRIAERYPDGLAPRFRVCDTLGVGLPYDDVALPRSVPAWIRLLRGLGLAPHQIELHPHNDTWLVVANCLAAVREGCGVINGTMLGTGERTGNAPLEAVAMHLLGMGYWADKRLNLPAVNGLVALYDEMGVGPSPKYPLFGRDAYITRAGIHADGLNKHAWMYASFNAPLLTGRELEVAQTKDSGQAGLLFVLNKRLGLTLAKDDPRVTEVYRWLDRQWAEGRVSAVEWSELEPVVNRTFAESAAAT
jgi:isopropylmalate/homocitrate/citramalate synthase